MDDFSMACLREVADLDSRLEHTRYWYGQRMDRLQKWAREELQEPLRTRFFAIVANGSPDVMEPPTSEQNYNGMTNRAEKAESELVRLRASIDGTPEAEKVQMPDKARAGIEVLHQAVEALLTTSRYVDEEGEATHALADLLSCIAEPPFRLAGSTVPDGVQTCEKCSGTGRVLYAPYFPVDCPDCGGAVGVQNTRGGQQ